MIQNGEISEGQHRHGSMVDLSLELHARDLSTEDAENVLDAFAEFKFRCTAEDTESPGAEKRLHQCQCHVDIPQGGISAVREAAPDPDPAQKKKPVKTKIGKYGIPKGLYKSNKKLYQKIWKRCKLEGITYEEALMEAPKLERKALNKIKDLAKVVEEKKATIEGADAPNDALPAERIPTRTEMKEADKSSAPAAPAYTGPIAVGMKVRQVSGRLRLPHPGTVKKINAANSTALVDMGNGIEWMPLSILAPVVVDSKVGGTA